MCCRVLWCQHAHACQPNSEIGVIDRAQVDIWDHERSEPVASYAWGSDSVTALRFNPAEPDVLASAGSDRSVALYDLRSGTPIRKIVMQVRLLRTHARMQLSTLHLSQAAGAGPCACVLLQLRMHAGLT